MKIGTNTNSNLVNSVVKFICSILSGKYPFWANSGQKFKAFCEHKIWYLNQLEYAVFDGDVQNFSFAVQNTLNSLI